jgi:hypothetical protein
MRSPALCLAQGVGPRGLSTLQVGLIRIHLERQRSRPTLHSSPGERSAERRCFIPFPFSAGPPPKSPLEAHLWSTTVLTPSTAHPPTPPASQPERTQCSTPVPLSPSLPQQPHRIVGRKQVLVVAAALVHGIIAGCRLALPLDVREGAAAEHHLGMAVELAGACGWGWQGAGRAANLGRSRRQA